MLSPLLRALACTVILLATGQARASSLTAAEILNQFNAVVTTTYTSNSDIEGRLLAGSIIGGATFYNQPRGGASTFGAVNALSVTSGVTSGNVNNSGNVNIQGTNAGHFNLNGGHYVSGPAFTIGDFTTPLNALQTQLAGLAANSTVHGADPNNFTFVVTPNAQGLAVFALTAAELSQARNIQFSNEAAASTIVINVTGNYTQTANFNASSFLNSHVIWNFVDATNLSFMGWHGAVLAGRATVTNSSAMEGFLYANTFNGRGELHDFPFAGTLIADPAPAVPEPAMLPVLLLGLAGLLVAGRWQAAPRSVPVAVRA